MLKTIKQMILNECELKQGLSATVAEIGGYSSVGNLNKFLKGNRKAENFSGYLDVVHHLFPDKAVELLKQESLSIDPKLNTSRYMLVYLELNKATEYLELLIDKMLYCGNKTSEQWARVFKTDMDYFERKTDFHETLDKVCSLKTECCEMEIYTSFLKAYLFLDQQYYDAAFSLTINLEKSIEGVKERFIRDTFTARLMLLLTEYSVRKGEVTKAREVALKMFNCIEDASYKAWAALHLGNSYITESFDKADSYFNLGLSLPKINSRVQNNLMSSKTFNENLWSNDPSNLNFDSHNASDKHEVAHYYIRQSENGKALKILMSLEDLTDNQQGFNYYLRGLITKNINDFCYSVKFFRKSGDIYFRKLPLIELKKLQVNECLIEALAQ
ncbi:AimR family lysis-lysogeny pheromone receptor [Peribacillus frigoritolerans]|uniref:AimR family lysis-lysogeny pheromone receptor n=1 Tax=Peribacillus frigoritolerans TaxID=450367 RepID=UPI0022267C2F|nr:AimR family lysis-lysogeny pheromone receptor [Peribacillus frigoritolerans]UYZ01186.1 AimR family lysis-lysogeny pheromone receptor [Peribacillus frigoritolerans]